MKKSTLKTFRNLGIILLISVGCTFYFAGFNTNLAAISLNVLYGVIIGLTIALGSSLITRSVFKRESVYDNPIRHYLIAITSVTIIHFRFHCFGQFPLVLLYTRSFILAIVQPPVWYLCFR